MDYSVGYVRWITQKEISVGHISREISYQLGISDGLLSREYQMDYSDGYIL